MWGSGPVFKSSQVTPLCGQQQEPPLASASCKSYDFTQAPPAGTRGLVGKEQKRSNQKEKQTRKKRKRKQLTNPANPSCNLKLLKTDSDPGTGGDPKPGHASCGPSAGPAPPPHCAQRFLSQVPSVRDPTARLYVTRPCTCT